MRVVVDNRLRITSELGPELREKIEDACTRSNPKHIKLKKMGYPPWSEPRQFVLHREEAGQLTLPRGATNHLRRIAQDHGEAVDWEDRRSEGSASLGEIPEHSVAEERRYQLEAVEQLAARESCLLKARTGSGKSTMALMLASRLQVPTLIMVWTGKLYEQWLERIRAELGLRGDEVGEIRGATKRIRSVTVAMQQTLHRCKPEWFAANAGKFGLVIFDEAQRVPAQSFVKVLDQFPARYRIGMSDDASRRDGLHFLTNYLFGDHVVEVDPQDSDVNSVDVEVRMIPTEFRADWYRHSPKPNFTKLLEAMTKDPARNSLIAGWATDELRDKNATMLFSHRVGHCEELAAMLRGAGFTGGLMTGGHPDFDRARELLAAGGPYWGAGTLGATAQGIDIPALARGIATTPIHVNRQQYRQLRGRLCRSSPGKAKAVLYVIWDVHVFGRLPLVNMLRWNQVVEVWDEGSGQWQPGRDYQGRMVADQIAANEL